MTALLLFSIAAGIVLLADTLMTFLLKKKNPLSSQYYILSDKKIIFNSNISKSMLFAINKYGANAAISVFRILFALKRLKKCQ